MTLLTSRNFWFGVVAAVGVAYVYNRWYGMRRMNNS